MNDSGDTTLREYFSSSQITIASYFGGPMAAGIMPGHNFLSFGNKFLSFTAVFVGGLATLIGALLFLFLLVDPIIGAVLLIMFWLFQAIFFGLATEFYIPAQLERGRSKEINWSWATFVAVSGAIIQLGAGFGLIVALLTTAFRDR